MRKNDELYHYGVKGMKWGVRKSKQSSSSGKSNKSNPGSSHKIEDFCNNEKVKVGSSFCIGFVGYRLTQWALLNVVGVDPTSMVGRSISAASAVAIGKAYYESL